MEIDKVESEVLKKEETEKTPGDLFDEEYALIAEALLFTSPVPLNENQIARIAGCDRILVGAVIEKLNRQYAQWGRTYRIERFGEGFRIFTLPDYDKYIARLAEIPRPIKLSKAALEVLAVIAYRQPMVRSEIDRIRGIDSGGVLRTLIERGLIAISGRSDGPGRPLLYKTTQEFLDFFGIANLSELPAPEAEPEIETAEKSLVLVRPPEIADTETPIDTTE